MKETIARSLAAVLVTIVTLLLLFLLSALSGCATVKLTPPDTPLKRLAYAVAGNAGARIKAAGSVQAGTISPSTGEQVLAATDGSRKILDVVGAELGVPVPVMLSGHMAERSLDHGVIDQLIAEALSAKSALVPARTVSAMIDAADAAGGDLTDQAVLSIYGMDDDARAGLVKTLEGK